jgi:hypothetical protein
MTKVPNRVITAIKHLVARSTSRVRLSLSATAMPATEGAKHRWVPMPGNCLEYGTTGWQIRMESTPYNGMNVVFFAVINPEGMTVSTSQHDLQGLKQAVERYSKDREEFTQ